MFTFRPELAEGDADDDEATEDMSIYRRADDEVSECSVIIDLFGLYILFSHSRPRDALMGIFLLFFH